MPILPPDEYQCVNSGAGERERQALGGFLAAAPDNIFAPATAAYTSWDADEYTESGVSRALDTGPTVPPLSYPVGYLTLRLSSALRTNNQFSCLEVYLGELRI